MTRGRSDNAVSPGQPAQQRGTDTGKATLVAGRSPDSRRPPSIDRRHRGTQLDAPTLVRFEARREQAGLLPITIRDLLRETFRHRLDRMLVGESWVVGCA